MIPVGIVRLCTVNINVEKNTEIIMQQMQESEYRTVNINMEHLKNKYE